MSNSSTNYARRHLQKLLPAVIVAGIVLVTSQLAQARGGKLALTVVDSKTQQPIPCRMHLKNSRGLPIKPRGTISWDDHFVFGGKIVLELPNGNYTFELERGPEYLARTGNFEINDGADDTKTVDLKRIVDMAAEGWWAGDLRVHRPPKDIPLLMQAEDLHLAHVVTWGANTKKGKSHDQPTEPLVRFDTNRCYHQLAGLDARDGSSLLLLNLNKPLDLSGARENSPSSTQYALAAREQGAWLDAATPFSWDLPTWVAGELLGSVELAHGHLLRRGVVDNEAGGMARDAQRYPGVSGNGRWSMDVYFHLLNCGLRIPPSAGSASGVAHNPVGYNRVYVHCGEQFSYDAWMKGLAEGRVVVTNGPLLRPEVQGQPPGYVFRGDAGETIELEIGLNLTTQDKVDYLEVIQDGQVVHEVRLADWAKKKGRLPPLVFKQSGWFLVRAVTDEFKTYRFAMTGPYYVEIGERPRISRRSAKFFLDWLLARAKAVDIADADQREQVIKYHRAARDYFQKLAERANAP